MTSKPWPWNKLSPADWGIGMTVCIAAMCEPDLGDEYIVSASDRMVSMGGYFSGDDAVRKADPIAVGWTSMIAGNDVSPAVPILAKIRQGAPSYDDTQEHMAEALKRAYREERLQLVEDEILSPYGLTWELFRKDARTQLPDSTYERIVERIRAYEMELTFLVSGFDSEGSAHIFTVSNPGKCDYYEKLGFWAIGSGQHQAVASLFSNHYNRYDSLEHCIAKVIAAKLTAESASGVGKTTWLIVDSPKQNNRSLHILPSTIDVFRREWDKLPRLPSNGISVILDNVNAERKRVFAKDAPTTSESQEPDTSRSKVSGSAVTI